MIQKEEKGDDESGIENLLGIEYAEQDNHARHRDKHRRKTVRKQGVEDELGPACDADEIRLEGRQT